VSRNTASFGVRTHSERAGKPRVRRHPIRCGEARKKTQKRNNHPRSASETESNRPAGDVSPADLYLCMCTQFPRVLRDGVAVEPSTRRRASAGRKTSRTAFTGYPCTTANGYIGRLEEQQRQGLAAGRDCLSRYLRGLRHAPTRGPSWRACVMVRRSGEHPQF